MNVLTHKMIDKELCGRPLLIDVNYSKVEMKTTQGMAVDVTGLVHGGFVFGLADYSAMLAVNHPNVVLGAAEVKFFKPVQSGDILIAEARAGEKEGKKQSVAVTVKKGESEVFKGMFICFTLDKHVLIN
jgi:acyl-coenzyme A thioesterase PaaI-like protein